MNKMLGSFVMTLALAGSVGCGKNNPGDVPGGSGDATPRRAVDCRVAAKLTDDAAPADAPDLRRVPAETMQANVGGKPTSLCDIVRQNGGKPLTVIQFTSTKCFTCMKWIEDTASGVAAGGFGDSVLNIAIMTDGVDELSDEDSEALHQEVAPSAVWARDTDLALWQFFSTGDDPLAKVGPLTVLMDYAARGFTVEDSAKSAADFVAVANQTMELGIKAP